MPENKITFIPYGTDVDMFNPSVDGSSFARQLGLENKFVVLYAGALGQANDIYTVLCAAKRLNDEKKIRFVFFGDGKERPSLQSEAERMELENVIFAGVCPKKEMPLVVASSDVCLAILQNIPMFRTTYPNKVFDYMAAARATVLVIDGVIREVIEAIEWGSVCRTWRMMNCWRKRSLNFRKIRSVSNKWARMPAHIWSNTLTAATNWMKRCSSCKGW